MLEEPKPRIFKVFSTIVTMMNRVIFQLWKFLTFFAILCVLLSLMYSILGVGNVMVPGDFRLVFYDENEPNKWSKRAPNAEYRQIGMFLGNIAQVLRIGTGDFSIIAQARYLGRGESIIFWLIFFLTVMVACVIFLNFIVAEASGTYNEVSEFLEETIQC